MTSNVGARQLKDFGQGVGFGTAAKAAQADENSKSIVENALKKTFAPEFLNRIDDVIMFDQLSKESISSIIDLELKGIFGRVTAMGYKLELTKEAKDYIAEKGDYFKISNINLGYTLPGALAKRFCHFRS
jgi:ATP-dependent Clp protease ATP-binding subunit ClpC